MPAPDGSPTSRTKVGVAEEVALASSVPATWTVSAGTFFKTGDKSATWTAPDTRDDCTITATPASGSPCSITMNVVPPALRILRPIRDLAYAADRSGSGFVAAVELWPRDVSFNRLEIREGEAEGLAAGYYDDILKWSGKMHPKRSFELAEHGNKRIEDTVGTELPGGPPPFSWGVFEWRIPQFYRRIGDPGDGILFDTPLHRQVMHGPDGAETTTKEDARRDRTPGPAPAPPTEDKPTPRRGPQP